MNIKSVQWNIGGGYLCEAGKDPKVQRSYTNLDLQYIIDQLREMQPDIITLQEVHSNTAVNQAEVIAQALGLEHWVSDFYSESHLAPGYQLGLAILSRFPLSEHKTVLLNNPHFHGVWQDGTVAKSHDKGVTSCRAQVAQHEVVIKTVQRVPMRKFGIDPFSPQGKAVFEDLAAKLEVNSKYLLIQGDFNLWEGLPPIGELIPHLIDKNTHELEQPAPTNPIGERPDRVVYRGLRPIHVQVVSDLRTDHYPILTTFALA